MAEEALAARVRGSGGPMGTGDRGERRVDETFALLAERRDRYVLAYLHLGDGIADLDALARQVLAWEPNGRRDGVRDAAVRELVEELAVERLPRLRAAGLVEYNLKTGCVVATDGTEAIGAYLDAALDDEPLELDRLDPVGW